MVYILIASNENALRINQITKHLTTLLKANCKCTTIALLLNYFTRRARRREHKPKSLRKLVHDEQLPMMTSPKDPVEMQRLNLETEGMASKTYSVV